MTTKKFTVTFTSDESTRWIENDNFLALQLKLIATRLAASVTTGNEPAVETCNDFSQRELLDALKPLPPR